MNERVQIQVGVAGGESARAIASRLGRAPSTVTREMARNGGRDAYGAVAAKDQADACRRRSKATRFDTDPVLAAHVEARLRALDSPMTISVELARGRYPGLGPVSHETIYQGIYAHGRTGLTKGLHGCLHRRHRYRKHRRSAGDPKPAGPLGAFNLIGLRPPAAAGRDEVGHFEGDLIIGARNASAMVTFADRCSRCLWLADLACGHGAGEVLAALIEICDRIPAGLLRTLTWDQGREMAQWPLLEAATGIDVYFAEPHSPWQRPTNENTNGLLRRYVGKGTNLDLHTTDDLRRIETRINTMPRRIHNWASAADRYHAAVALTG